MALIKLSGLIGKTDLNLSVSKH